MNDPKSAMLELALRAVQQHLERDEYTAAGDVVMQALARAEQMIAPEGWKRVPREATDEMMQAAWDMSNAIHDTPEADDPLPRHLYRAMVDAAPQGASA